MKKLMLFAAVAVFGLSNVNAQEAATTGTGGFAKGDIYLSGMVGFNSTKYGDSKTNSFGIAPMVGFFLTDNIALEANLLFGSTKNEDDDKSTDFGGGLGANYFFTPANQFSFTIGVGAFYTSSKYDPDGGDSSKFNTFGGAVVPGLSYFVSDCVALRASIGALSYASGKSDQDGAEAQNDFGFNLDLTDINFGVTYKF